MIDFVDLKYHHVSDWTRISRDGQATATAEIKIWIIHFSLGLLSESIW